MFLFPLNSFPEQPLMLKGEIQPKSIQNKRRRVQVKLHKTVFWVLEGGKGHFARLKTETSENVRKYIRTTIKFSL